MNAPADTAAPAAPAEPAGNLAALANLAAKTDAELAGEAPGAQAAPPAPTLAERGAEFSAMLGALVGMAEPLLPFLPKCYTPEVCDRIGTSFAAVAEKRGWQLDALNTPEIALAVCTVPPTIQAIIIGRQYFAWRAAQAALEQARSEGRVPPAPAPAAPAAAPSSHAGERLQPSNA